MTEILSQSRALLAATPARWRALVEAATPALLARPPARGEWSAVECLQHLLDTEDHVFPIRVRAFLAGEDFPGFDPDAQGMLVGAAVDPRVMVERFAHERAASAHLLSSLAAVDLSRTARHAELGVVTLDELLNHWVGHDLAHTVQAERALMQPFIVASGPWRGYYVDHDVEATRES
jgi:hypothetical protein